MEDNMPRWKESVSLSSVANGLENMGAEFLESMVCPLSPPPFGPLVGGASFHWLPLCSLVTYLLEHLGTPQCVSLLSTEQPPIPCTNIPRTPAVCQHSLP